MECKFCKQPIENIRYSLNDGIYGNCCYKIGLLLQEQKLRQESLKERIKLIHRYPKFS